MPRLPLVIERAKEEDSEAICELDRRQIGTSKRRNYILDSMRDGHCLVAKLQGKPVGFAITDQTFYEQSFIWLLMVDPEYRRKGIASELIRRVESDCPTGKLFTSTNQSNLIMQRLMDKLGFVRTGHIENLDEGDPEIVYFKRIKTKRREASRGGEV